MSPRSFYPIFLSFFVGVFAASFLKETGSLVYILSAIAFFASLGLFAGAKKKPYLIAALSVAAFALGFLRMDASLAREHPLDPDVGRGQRYAGIVCAEPEAKETTLRFRFCIDGSEDAALVTSGRYPEYRYGDRLVVSGKLGSPKNFEAYEGGPTFDYVSYLAKDGIRYEMFRPKIEKIKEGEGNPVVSALISFKTVFIRKAQVLFPEPESSLLGGLLLGEKDSLPKDVTDDFKTAGLVHMLVLSGYNVTIVAESLMKLFSFLPRLFAQATGGLSIVLFAVMTGASSTTVRASIMALVLILARSTSRRYDVTRALVLAAFCMVIENPAILAFDTSFQLSFLATLGLVYVSPLIADRLGFVTEKLNLREVLATTLGTQAFVAPFLMHAMGQISLVSVVSNIFALPVVPYAMLGGFLAILVGFISSSLGFLVAWPVSIVLSYVIFVAHMSAQVPFASIKATASAFSLAVAYAVLASILIRAWRRRGSSRPSAN